MKTIKFLVLITCILLITSLTVAQSKTPIPASQAENAKKPSTKRKITPSLDINLPITTIPNTTPHVPVYACGRPVGGKHRVPRGDWSPLNNTNNWQYLKRHGPDYFVRKEDLSQALQYTGIFADHVSAVCKNNFDSLASKENHYDDGVKVEDYEGEQDWCIFENTFPNPSYDFTPMEAWQSPCPSGYQHNHKDKLCYRPERKALEIKVSKPKGQWSPLHNTNNWEYFVRPGQDYYRKKSNHNKKLGLTCIINGRKDFKRRNDHEGNQDWCVNVTQEYLAEDSQAMACPEHTILADKTLPQLTWAEFTISQGNTGNTVSDSSNNNDTSNDDGDNTVSHADIDDSRPCEPCPNDLGTFDGNNCLITQSTAARKAFLYDNGMYIKSITGTGSDCPAGSGWDSANCYFGKVPAGRTVLEHPNGLYLKNACVAATDYQCLMDAEIGDPVTRPRGEWKAFHDVSKWSLQTFWGKDYYVRNSEYKLNQILQISAIGNIISETVNAVCLNGKRSELINGQNFNGLIAQIDNTFDIGEDIADGTYTEDKVGAEDWCTLPTDTERWASACPDEYLADQETKRCERPYIPAYNKPLHKAKGDWNALHNTNNWVRKTVVGADYYKKNWGNNTLQLKCEDGQTRINDFKNNEDWCVQGTSALSADTKAMSCEAGFTLTDKLSVQ